MNRILNGSCHCAQNLIAVSAAEKVIDQRESIDIRTDHVVIDLCVFNQQTLTVGIEEFLAVKLGQTVFFQNGHRLRGFHQLDRVGNLVLDDFRLVRLRQVIDCPQRQRPDLAFIAFSVGEFFRFSAML